jgi:hypothetical protein
MRTRVLPLLGLSIALILLAAASVASADDGSVRLTANLEGAQEFPVPADPDGSGKAIVDVDVAGNEVCFDIKFDGIQTPSRAHIHEAAAGANGGIVVTFWELRVGVDPGAPATDPRNDVLEDKERLSGCTEVTDTALLQRIVDNPAGFYVNVHNARFPGGALRCQLEP